MFWKWSMKVTLALYLPSYANELFYLCKVIRFGKAELTDKFNHVIHKDEN